MTTSRGWRSLVAALALGLAAGACAPTSTSPSPAGSPSGPAASSAAPSPSTAPTPTPAPAIGACGGLTADRLPWWNDRVFYEVFVRSFQDSDGDGIGDLQGLISRLDYLNDGDPATTADLGVTGIWLMPVAESPSYHGYDVTDYLAVEADYGTADDFRQLMAEAHERGIAVVVDLVLNHTSVEHPWFVDAKIPGSAHDAWYQWATEDPKVTKPGGGRVWHRAGSRFYYSYFWEGMADLDLANPEVTDALDEVGRYWLEDLGVDGFRLDAIKHLFEEGAALEELPETHVWLAGYQDRLEAIDPDVMLVGEVYSATRFAAAYVPETVDLTFDFGFAQQVVGGLFAGGAQDATKALVEALAAYPPGQRAVFLTNHDQTRTMTKLGDDVPSAKAAAAVLLTQPGVPFLYYGEEVGLLGDKPDERIRTPMPWDASATVGFTTGTPWQPPQEGAESANVASQTDDPASLLSAYRELIALRTAHPALRGAETVVLPTSTPRILAYLRHAAGQTILVVVNFGRPLEGASVDLSGVGCVAEGMTATVRYGAAEVAPLTGDLAAWVPVPELGPSQVLIVELGG